MPPERHGDAGLRALRDADTYLRRGLWLGRVEPMHRGRRVRRGCNGVGRVRDVRIALANVQCGVRLGDLQPVQRRGQLHAGDDDLDGLRRMSGAHVQRDLRLSDRLLVLYVHAAHAVRLLVPRRLPRVRGALRLRLRLRLLELQLRHVHDWVIK